MYYSVLYVVSELKLSCGILATFPNLYAAKKYAEQAELALKNSGLYGIIKLETHTVDINIDDPVSFFEEF
jgi:hypothetical protein